MDNFWFGLLALPVLAIAVAAAAAALFGSWLLYEKWAKGRGLKLQEVQMPTTVSAKFDVTTLPDFNGRDVFASLVLTSRKVRFLRLTDDTGIILVSNRHGDRIGKNTRMLRQALNDALLALHKKEAGIDKDAA